MLSKEMQIWKENIFAISHVFLIFFLLNTRLKDFFSATPMSDEHSGEAEIYQETHLEAILPRVGSRSKISQRAKTNEKKLYM